MQSEIFQCLICFWYTCNSTGGCSRRIWLEVGSWRCFPPSQEGHATVCHAGMRNTDMHHGILHSWWVVSLCRGGLIYWPWVKPLLSYAHSCISLLVQTFCHVYCGSSEFGFCFFSVVFACLGFLSPANRGALMTCALVSLHNVVLYWLLSNITV